MKTDSAQGAQSEKYLGDFLFALAEICIRTLLDYYNDEKSKRN